MKRNLFLLFALLTFSSVYSSNLSIVTGTWTRGKEKEISLYRILSGRLLPVATYQIEDDNKFYFALEPKEEGFFVVGSGSPQAANNKYTFYFKPGDQLNISINDSTYVLTGKNTPENEAMAKWHNFTYPLEIKSVYFFAPYGRTNGMPSTYVDFFPLLQDYSVKAKSFTSNTGNAKFEKAFEKFRNLDLIRYSTTFIMTPRSAHPEKEDYPPFYKELNVGKLTSTTDLLQYPFGVGMINSVTFISDKFSDDIKKVTTDSPSLSKEEMSELASQQQAKTINSIVNETLKGEVAITFAGRLKTYDEYKSFEKKYGQYIITPDQKARMSDIVTKIAQNKPISETIDFAGTDLDDKKISLSDFKGKVVVVDVWATWCGPCKKEIPSLKAMEKDYHGKDVVFMSISLDELKNKQKWVDFVKKEELTGVQLFGGNGMASDVAKFYKVNSIPRFLVFGKDGKIVTDDSPRPSSPALKVMLDEQLKK